MDRETAIRKVLRCLRLAGSSNPHEAAAALRQARALMTEHGLSEIDALASEVSSAEAKTRARGASLPQSIAWLVSVVANGFRCEVVIARSVGWRARSGSTEVRFFGMGSDARIAAYAFEVLRRQLESDKAKHTARIRKRANRQARGETFAIGWVSAVASLFPRAELSADQGRAVAAAATAASDGGTHESRDLTRRGKASWTDRAAGYLKGREARVHAAVDGAAQPSLEHLP